MPVRNVDRLQDAWHAAGRYQRGSEMTKQTQDMVKEMFPPVPVDYTVKGYTATYIGGVADRCISALCGEHLTAPEIAERVGVSVHSVVKAIGVAVSNGHPHQPGTTEGGSMSEPPRRRLSCPYCGRGWRMHLHLTPFHREADGRLCPGSKQNPRCDADRRPLWRECLTPDEVEAQRGYIDRAYARRPMRKAAA